jgi:hypothetical protein
MAKKNFINYFFLCLSTTGVVYSFVLFAQASKPCSSDGCMIHLLYIPALLLLLLFGPVLFITGRNIYRKIHKDADDN